ncbi:ANTAR domain-containing protein [Streptomyces sp. NPDC006193]|uniref:ANTAR domain-containing protein n=1 Tax=Streptomyces sp. NPDC006193 TaxID=3155717 RepID=UPI0033B91811
MRPSPGRPAAPAPVIGSSVIGSSVIESPLVDGLPAGGAVLLRMAGSLDADGARAWAQELRGHLERADRAGLRPVLDMAHVQLGGAAVLRTLSETTRARAGLPDLIVVRARPGVREAVHLARLDGVRLYATLDEALHELARAASPVEELPAWQSRMADPLRPSYEDLHKEVRALRARVRTAPVIGMAQGVLMVRYGLPDGGAAFRALRDASQRFNVPLRVLVSALLVARPPDGGVWFPGRRPPVPPLRLLARDGRDPRCRRRMIDAVLHEALAAGRAPGGLVLVVDPAVNALTPESHHGCADALLDRFWRGRAGGSAEEASRIRRRPVGVPDVATDGQLPEDARRALLACGVRALHSVPALSSAGSCTGVITLHWPDAGHVPAPARAETLTLLAADTAAWLGWYHRAVLPDALEHVHRLLSRDAPRTGSQGCASLASGWAPVPRTDHVPPEGVRRMSDPQQPEQRRSDKGGATPQDSGELKARQSPGGGAGARPHGTDKGAKGGGEGGGVPPAQQPDHP